MRLSIRTLFFSTALFILTLLAVLVVPAAHAATCNQLSSADSVPNGYGASYNVFKPGELLVSVLCTDTNKIHITAGNNDQNTYVYNKGYRYENGAWKQYTLSCGAGEAVSGAWCVGNASASLNTPATGQNYLVAYTCQYRNSAWKCGCSDTTCATPKWQLQVFGESPTSGGDTGGNSTNTNNTGGNSTSGGDTGGSSVGGTYAPANPHASKNVRAVLAYLHDLPNHSAHVIPGQMLGWPWRDSFWQIEEIHKKYGVWPGVLHVDMASCVGGFNWNANLPRLIDYWNKGGLISASVHYTDPVHGTCARSQEPYPNITKVITKGTSENTKFTKELNEVAQKLQVLEDAGVVVMFAPMNESDIGTQTKWWAGRTPSDSIALYRYIFNYFTNSKKLDNLIWTFDTRRENGNAAKNLYPGDAYVDISGQNHGGHYEHPEDGQFIGAYNAHMKHNKIFAFSEGMNFGKVDNFDWMRVITAIKKYYPKTTYWVNYDSWVNSDGKTIKSGLQEDGRNVGKMLSDPIIVTRDEMNWRAYLQ